MTGSCEVSLYLPGNHSLKDKRRVLKSLISRLRQRFNVSVAEVGDQDNWQRATIGLSCVSGEYRHLEEMLGAIIEWLDRQDEVFVHHFHKKIV